MNLIDALKTLKLAMGRIENDDISDMQDRANLLASQGSMTNILADFVIEPLVLVSTSVKDDNDIDDIVKFNVDVFSMLYMDAINILINAYGMDAKIAFDVLSTKAAPSFNIYSDVRMDREEISSFFDNEALDGPFRRKPKKQPSSKTSDPQPHMKDGGIGEIAKSFIKRLNITINVTNKKGNTYTINMPAIFKPIIVDISFDKLQSLLDENSTDNSFFMRTHMLAAGEITWKQYITGSDIVKRIKDKRLADASEIIKFIRNRAKTSDLKILNGGYAGLSKYYSCTIIDNQEAAMLEAKYRGRLKNDDFKDRVCSSFYSSLLTVYNRDYERVQLYIKDIPGISNMRVKDIKKKVKSNNADDLKEILTAVMSSKPII